MFSMQAIANICAELLAPAGYLPVLAPWILVLAAPTLALNLFSSNPGMYSGRFQYNAEIVPILVFAAIEADGSNCMGDALVPADDERRARSRREQAGGRTGSFISPSGWMSVESRRSSLVRVGVLGLVLCLLLFGTPLCHDFRLYWI